VLHELPAPGEDERRGAFFWRKPNGHWEFSGRGSGLKPLQEHVRAYDQAEEALDKEYAQAQDAQDYFAILKKLAPLVHAAKNLHATLQAAREAIPDDRDIISLRDWAYELERSFELLYGDAKAALDYSIAQKAEEEAVLSRQAIQTAHRLNILAAIFFPLTAIGSVFGMNLRSGLEQAPTGSFGSCSCLGSSPGLLSASGYWAASRSAPKRSSSDWPTW